MCEGTSDFLWQYLHKSRCVTVLYVFIHQHISSVSTPHICCSLLSLYKSLSGWWGLVPGCFSLSGPFALHPTLCTHTLFFSCFYSAHHRTVLFLSLMILFLMILYLPLWASTMSQSTSHTITWQWKTLWIKNGRLELKQGLIRIKTAIKPNKNKLNHMLKGKFKRSRWFRPQRSTVL